MRILKTVFIVILFCSCLTPAKINSAQNPETVQGIQFGGIHDDFPYGVITDAHDNIYIAGFTKSDLYQTSSGGKDVFLCKMDQNQTIIWSRQFGSEHDDEAKAVAVDAANNCYLTGFVTGPLDGTYSGGKDAFVCKFTESGAKNWLRLLGTEKDDEALSVTIDKTGFVYISGITDTTLCEKHFGKKDFFIAKYDLDGKLIWKKQFGTPEDELDCAITLNRQGHIFLVGLTTGDFAKPNAGIWDIVVVELNPSGEIIRKMQFGTSQHDMARGIGVDDEGFIYIGGSSGGDMEISQKGGGDAFLTKFDKNGKQLWVRQFGTHTWDGIHALCFDKTGDDEKIIVSGCQRWKQCQGFVRSYTKNGELLACKEFGNDSLSSTCGQTLTINTAGEIFHIGGTNTNLFSKSAGGQDVYLVKLRME